MSREGELREENAAFPLYIAKQDVEKVYDESSLVDYAYMGFGKLIVIAG
jgi:hypothetical protein